MRRFKPGNDDLWLVGTMAVVAVVVWLFWLVWL